MKYYLAIDIGASSGRGIIGYLENQTIQTIEIYRFQNHMENKNGHLVWDIDHLFSEVKSALKIGIQEYHIESVSIDTWGVDYVLMNHDQEILPAYAYRDHRTEESSQWVHERIPFEILYKHTGCQFQPFNTIYQLADDLVKGRLENATDYLMMPEYLAYKLTGNKVKEFTNATTTGLINANTLNYDQDIIQQLSFPVNLFKHLVQPGSIVGYLTKDLQVELGGNTKVIHCATHDTASAVEGIPMEGKELYISSGTWSLLGVKTNAPITTLESMKANYSNEGGVHYNRYQKNIMGMWIVNELRQELCPDLDFNTIVDLAKHSDYDFTFNANDESLLSPGSMKEAIDALLEVKPVTLGDYFNACYLSLAKSYRYSIQELESNTHTSYKQLYIVGGGAKNQYLNELTQKETKKEVIALPIEATAIGNLKIQIIQGEENDE